MHRPVVSYSRTMSTGPPTTVFRDFSTFINSLSRVASALSFTDHAWPHYTVLLKLCTIQEPAPTTREGLRSLPYRSAPNLPPIYSICYHYAPALIWTETYLTPRYEQCTQVFLWPVIISRPSKHLHRRHSQTFILRV